MFDYGKILRRSIEIVKKNKWLWIYGALVAGGFSSGGGSGGGGGGGSDINNFKDIKKDIKLDDLPEQTSYVLGTYTNSLKDWFSGVSLLTWVLLILGIVLAVVIGIIVSLILQNWARASLIAGVQMALNDQFVDLTNTSPTGKAKTKTLIVYSLIVSGIIFGTLFAIVAVGGTTYLLFKDQATVLTVLAILFVIPVVIFLVTGSLLLTMTGIYAERLIVLKNYSPVPALKKGIRLAKKTFMGNAIMGLIGSITTGIFGFITAIITLIILGIPAFAMTYPSIATKTWPSPIVWVFLGLFLLIFIVVMSLVSAATQVFKFSNWNQVFNEVMGKEQNNA